MYIHPARSFVRKPIGFCDAAHRKTSFVADATELMERVRSRDADAFEALYDEYHRLVYGVALRVLSDPEGAEDVTQSVFLKIWDSPETFRKGNFAGWIARVTRNRAFDALRSRSAHPTEELPEALSVQDALEDTAFAHLDAESIRSALSRLSDEERTLVELGFFAGLSHQELARRVSCPLGTVKTRMRTALRKLRTVLDGVVTR
jgi:RNA polymerase sigma-70 factor (ECF subfamily)